jgi:hypothetical protein
MSPEYNTCYLNTVGMDEMQPAAIDIFPVPAKDQIMIKISNDIEIKSLQIISLSGQLLKAFNVDQTSLDISSLPGGIYVLTILTTKGRFHRKVVIH